MFKEAIWSLFSIVTIILFLTQERPRGSIEPLDFYFSIYYHFFANSELIFFNFYFFTVKNKKSHFQKTSFMQREVIVQFTINDHKCQLNLLSKLTACKQV